MSDLMKLLQDMVDARYLSPSSNAVNVVRLLLNTFERHGAAPTSSEEVNGTGESTAPPSEDARPREA